MTLNAYEFNNLLTALPALRKIYNSGTLKDYFQEELADFLLETDATHMGYKPYRTYLGPRYIGGYSDHLPIFLRLQVSQQKK